MPVESCGKCHYDLTGLPQPVTRCPECGAVGTLLRWPKRRSLIPCLIMCGPFIPLGWPLAWLAKDPAPLLYVGLAGPAIGAAIAFHPAFSGLRWSKASPLIALVMNALQCGLFFLIALLLYLREGTC